MIRVVSGSGKRRSIRRTWFSPVEDVQAELLSAIAGAVSSIDLLIFTFTLDALADILSAKQRTGAQCRVVIDATQAGIASGRRIVRRLRGDGVDVVLTKSPAGGIMHEKVALIDVRGLGVSDPRSVVIYGSYNFTEAAARQENHLSIDSSDLFCARYMERCDELARHGSSGRIKQTKTENSP